jgi:hypothetical protein
MKQKVRTYKQLFLLLKKQIEEVPENDFFGMCGELTAMHVGVDFVAEGCKINDLEYQKVRGYFDRNKGNDNSLYDYWWCQLSDEEIYNIGLPDDHTGHEKYHRIEWINEQINKL